MIRIAAILAAFAIVGVAVGAWYVRRTQLQRLVTAADAVDEVLDEWHADRATIVADLPSAHYRTPEVERDAAQRLQRATTAATVAVDDATERVRGVHITRLWNGAADVARNSYLQYVAGWFRYLNRVADDPVPALEEPPPTFEADRAAATEAFNAAAPPLAGAALHQRIAELFTH